jgi:putative transposase
VSAADRSQVLSLVAEAVLAGSRQSKACEVVGIDERTLQRWQQPETAKDGRRGPSTEPRNKLSAAEREAIVATAASPEFCNKSPHQIVPALADKGEYLASESSFYRLLKESQMLAHRGKAAPKTIHRPKALEAVKPNELYSWDITYLLSSLRGQYFYLYLFLDIFSRKIVGWRVHDRESADFSSALLTEICKREGIDKDQLWLHADNGGPMKGATMLVTMQRLGIMPSFSRPSVSDDNPFSESVFKTMKYCPRYPSKPFDTIEAAIAWVDAFVAWYNNEHLHSAIRFVTPASRHCGTDVAILENRISVYKAAKNRNPSRWSKNTRNWDRIAAVKLNFLKEQSESATKAAVA